MYYEINVAKKNEKLGWDGKPAYSHFFATSDHSCVSKEQATEVYYVLKARFSEPDYKISVSLRQHTGHDQTAEFESERLK